MDSMNSVGAVFKAISTFVSKSFQAISDAVKDISLPGTSKVKADIGMSLDDLLAREKLQISDSLQGDTAKSFSSKEQGDIATTFSSEELGDISPEKQGDIAPTFSSEQASKAIKNIATKDYPNDDALFSDRSEIILCYNKFPNTRPEIQKMLRDSPMNDNLRKLINVAEGGNLRGVASTSPSIDIEFGLICRASGIDINIDRMSDFAGRHFTVKKNTEFKEKFGVDLHAKRGSADRMQKKTSNDLPENKKNITNEPILSNNSTNV